MNKLYRPNYLFLNLAYSILFILTLFLNYVYGVSNFDMVIVLIAWCVSYVLNILFLKNLEFLSIFYKVKNFSYFTILFLIEPVLAALLNVLDRQHISSTSMQFFITIFVIIIFTIFFIGTFLCYVFYSKKYQQQLARLIDPLKDNIPSQPNQVVEETTLAEPEELLGRGNTSIDKVINSILFRASSSIKASKFSLVVMVILVFIGGGASIGTIALDQFSKVREVEKHRLALLKIEETLAPPTREDFSVYDTLTRTGGSVDGYYEYYFKDSLILTDIKKAIASTYGSKETYKDLLDSINRQSNFSITEIIMRITIAALTLFLVQVFFHIYRFNQQQSTSLFTKAEVIELYNEGDADKKYLREILATKLEENPKFGKSPSTPIEQIINIADKGKNAIN